MAKFVLRREEGMLILEKGVPKEKAAVTSTTMLPPSNESDEGNLEALDEVPGMATPLFIGKDYHHTGLSFSRGPKKGEGEGQRSSYRSLRVPLLQESCETRKLYLPKSSLLRRAARK